MFMKATTKAMTMTTTLALTLGLAAAQPVFASTMDPLPGKKASPRFPVEDEKSLVKSDFAPGKITELCDAAMAQSDAKLKVIASVEPSKRTIDNTLMALETVIGEFWDTVNPLTFMNYVSADKKLRDEAEGCSSKTGEYIVGVFTRKDLYEATKDAQGRNPAEKRLASETRKAFESNGLKLDAEKLAQVKDLKSQLSKLETEFSSNLNNDSSKLELTREELTGVSESNIATFTKNGDKYVVVVSPVTYQVIMDTANVSETRKKMLSAWENRQAETNTKLLEQAVSLRTRIAKLMGYETWADYRTELRMAKTGKTAIDFLANLKGKLRTRLEADMAQLLAYKKTVDPKATSIEPWDLRWAAYQIKKRDYTLDDEVIKPYFPADATVQGMFNVYSKILGVKYVEVEGAHVWSPGVKLYRIVEATGNGGKFWKKSQKGQTLGYFFTDFYPRDGKYKHAAAFTLISGKEVPGKGYQTPVSSIVSNFNPPTGDKPSLLTHDQVETLFHEFGHIMHQTLTKAPYASQSGTSVAQDFVEAPSQMLENWVWNADIVSSVSGRYDDPSKKLPKELLDKLVKVQDFNQGYTYSRQLVFGMFDLAIHTSSDGKVDVTEAYNKAHKDVIGMAPIEGGHFPASFGHMMGGYDAGYYGYLWSEVYAQDMFTMFEKKSLLDAKVGKRYRETILESGNMLDAGDLLVKFLGRQPNNAAFFKKLGIK